MGKPTPTKRTLAYKTASAEFDAAIEIRAAARERVNALLRNQILGMQEDMEASLNARYGDDQEARKAVRLEFEKVAEQINARIREEKRLLFGHDSRQLLEDQEKQLLEERDDIILDHLEWTEREVERRRQQLQDEVQGRIRAMVGRIEEATARAASKAAKEEEDQTVEEMSRLEAEMGEATQEALKELTQKWEERQEEARHQIQQEVREAQVARTAARLDMWLTGRKEEALAQVRVELERVVKEEQAKIRREFWEGHAGEVAALEGEVEASTREVRDEVSAVEAAMLLGPVEEAAEEVERVRQDVLHSMERGSFVAEAEYTRLIEMEPGIREGMRRYRALVGKLLDLMSDVVVQSRPLKITGRTIRKILRDYDKKESEDAASSSSSLRCCCCSHGGGSEADEEDKEDGRLVGDLTIEDLLAAVAMEGR